VGLEPTSGEGGVYTRVYGEPYGQESAGRECIPGLYFCYVCYVKPSDYNPECSNNLPAVLA
jgi:hypothetical protein